MAHHLYTDIEIDAEPGVVWAILTDLAGYPEWNPFITSATGVVAVGERLTNRIEPPGGKPMTFKPTLTEVDDGHTLKWLGRLGLPGLFDGRHRFEIIPHGVGSRLIQTERCTGILVPFLRSSLDERTFAGFREMNSALKVRAEAAAQGGGRVEVAP